MARQNAAFIVKSGKKHLRGCSIFVGDKRTTVRLSPVVADAIEKIAAHECCDLDELYTSSTARRNEASAGRPRSGNSRCGISSRPGRGPATVKPGTANSSAS